MSEIFDFEKVERRQKLLHNYVALSDKMEEAYKKGDFKTAKNAGLAILKEAYALKEDGTFEDIFNPSVNKRIADYAIFMFLEEKLDALEKELLRLLFNNNVMDINYIKGFFNNICSFKKIEYAVDTFNFFNEIDVLSKEEADLLINNACENDGEIVLSDSVAEAALEALKQDLLAFLAKNQPMPQKDFVVAWRDTKPFSRIGDTNGVVYCLDDVFRNLVNEGKIRREKNGRSFTLFVNQ